MDSLIKGRVFNHGVEIYDFKNLKIASQKILLKISEILKVWKKFDKFLLNIIYGTMVKNGLYINKA